LLPVIESVLRKKGWETFIFKVGGTPEDIFARDYNQLKTCDLIVAEVSAPSHGVGAEIGISYCLNLKRILLVEKGGDCSKLLLGIPNTILIEYDGSDDLVTKLANIIK